MPVYKCPKCSGSNYFMSARIADEYGVQKVPVCRTCDEIMDRYKSSGEQNIDRWINIFQWALLGIFAITLAYQVLNSDSWLYSLELFMENKFPTSQDYAPQLSKYL